jgi:hypothetical protein
LSLKVALELILKVLQHVNDGHGTTIDKQQDTNRMTQGNNHKTSDLTFI